MAYYIFISFKFCNLNNRKEENPQPSFVIQYSSPTPKKIDSCERVETRCKITSPEYQGIAATLRVGSESCPPEFFIPETPRKRQEPTVQVPNSQTECNQLLPRLGYSTKGKRLIDVSSPIHETLTSSSYQEEDGYDNDDTSFQSSAPAKKKPRHAIIPMRPTRQLPARAKTPTLSTTLDKSAPLGIGVHLMAARNTKLRRKSGGHL